MNPEAPLKTVFASIHIQFQIDVLADAKIAELMSPSGMCVIETLRNKARLPRDALGDL